MNRRLRRLGRRWRRLQNAATEAHGAARRWRRRQRTRLSKRLKRWKAKAESWERRLAQWLLLLAGWVALTFGVAELFGAGRIVWPIFAGLLAWGLYGFKTIGITMWLGLAALRKKKVEHQGDR